MLLRRVTEHVKSENWFAVFVDLAIVVVGVFIGIQVSNWNDSRIMQARAEALTERLNDDFGVDAWLANNILRYHEDVLDNANRVLSELAGQAMLSDEDLLIAAHRASQFNRFTPSSSTYDELVATGGLELVAKSDVGRVAAIFYGSTIIDEIETDGKSSKYRYLFRSVVPVNVQLEVREKCGDRRVSVRNLLDEVSAIGCTCTLDMPAERLSAAATVLRQRPELVEALRHRIATLATHNSDLRTIVNATQPYRAEQQVLAESSALAVFSTDE